MKDEKVEELTPEELEILEGPPALPFLPQEEKAEETKEPAGEPEKPSEPEDKTGPEWTEKVQKRIDRLTWENKLLRENPEEYFRQFPDKRPVQKPEPEKPAVKPADDISQLVVTGTRTDIDGMTLAEAYIHNPVLAADLQYKYYQGKEREQRENEQKVTSYQEAANREIGEFRENRAVALFGKKEVTPEQELILGQELTAVIDWMEKTKRGGGILKDAYFLMNRDKELASAAARGADALLNSLESTSRSVSTGADTGKVTGFERYMGMSEEQMAEEVDKMGRNGGQAFKIFKQKAPVGLRKKFPDLFDE